MNDRNMKPILNFIWQFHNLPGLSRKQYFPSNSASLKAEIKIQSSRSAACSKASIVHVAPSLTDARDQREGIAAVPESCFEAALPAPTSHDPVGV